VCGRPTWAGCGQHIEEALAGVPLDERCKCPREEVFTECKEQTAPATSAAQ